ncbi:unnamed protein product [Rotaria socialis]|uniref:G-protein coupled receptors family 1 profile domain-containing protein n=1 Tax=Rotaria socialis TaxID=392032 RepID=A0A820XX21_9BILA|nr:unnamed protein product [Rotaria socialis]CAF3465027.1 unnamed protein product [Rotaria socialis]CAF3527577.1 unnamed protein product [Rotaria socialis]CAF4133158.1 unnamed protein product [Rotaria socialis]CAF4384578.1 unnamed protein product [Rotaria socialis]
MNIENFEYYTLYSILPLQSSDSTVIKFVVRFHRIYPWVLLPFGFIGSLLTILIFTRKKFQRFGCSILFVAESFMDLLLITINCIHLIILYTFKSFFFQRYLHLFRIYKFLTNYCSHCAVWILCVISLERAAVTRSLVWNQNVFNHKHSYCILIIIYTVLFFFNLHYLIFYGPEQRQSCRFNNNQTEKRLLAMCKSHVIRSSTGVYDDFLKFYFTWMDFIINSLIPFMIILLANATVMYSVCKQKTSMRQLGVRQTRSARETQLAYILFASTLLFVLLTFPLRVFSLIEPRLHYEKEYLILLDGIMRFLLYLDHGCGFYLYTFTGELFRREFKKFSNDFLYLIFRRHFFNWSSIESRRQSDSNGGAVIVHIIYSHSQQPQQHGQSILQDSTNNCGPIKLSLQELELKKTFYGQAFHPHCTYARQRSNRSFSTSSSQETVSPNTGQQNLLSITTDENNHMGVFKRHSSYCLESHYPHLIVPLTSSNNLHRKSDIF